jgi:hypothetical protein
VTDFKLTVPMGGSNLLNNTAPNCSDNEEIIVSDADNDWSSDDAVLMAGVKDSKKCL